MKLVAEHEGEQIPVEVEREGNGYRVTMRGESSHVDLMVANRFVRSLLLQDGTQFALIHDRHGSSHQISLGNRKIEIELHDPLAMRGRRRDDMGSSSGHVTAPMPGRVVRVLVAAGDEVRRGMGLLILEAMKMENEIQAQRDGRVAEVRMEAGQTVEGGATLLIIE